MAETVVAVVRVVAKVVVAREVETVVVARVAVARAVETRAAGAGAGRQG